MSWMLDKQHANVGFAARHMMISSVRGRFTDFDAVIELDPEVPQRSRVEALVRTASLDSGDEARDEHLRGADFLDVERYPEIRFRSTRVSAVAEGGFALAGELTVRGVTREVVLRGEFAGPLDDPWGARRAGFSLRGEIDREDFGLTWNLPLAAGGLVVGRTVELRIDAEVLEQSDDDE